MYVGYTNSCSVCFFVLLNFYVCRLSKILRVWIFWHVLTWGERQRTYSSWMGKGKTPLKCRWGRDLTACLVGLQSRGIASGSLLDKDGSEVCRILGLYWVFTYVVFLYYWIPMKVGGAIYSQCEYFFTCADLRGPRAWILCTTPLYLFVPWRIGTVKLLSACL